MFLHDQPHDAEQDAISWNERLDLTSNRSASNTCIQTILCHNRQCFQEFVHRNMKHLRPENRTCTLVLFNKTLSFLLCCSAQRAVQSVPFGSLTLFWFNIPYSLHRVGWYLQAAERGMCSQRLPFIPTFSTQVRRPSRFGSCEKFKILRDLS
jgi:hypothetical protein